MRSFMAHPRAAVARQRSPPRYRVGPHQLARNPAGMARSRGRAGTPTSDGAPGSGHRFPPPWAGSQPQARTPTSGAESDPPHPTARTSWADAEGVCPADTHTLRPHTACLHTAPVAPTSPSPHQALSGREQGMLFPSSQMPSLGCQRYSPQPAPNTPRSNAPQPTPNTHGQAHVPSTYQACGCGLHQFSSCSQPPRNEHC